jgi:hypothetical protein
MWIRKIVAYLIYDRKWEWLEKAINTLCEVEMAIEGYIDRPCVAEGKLSENLEKIPQGMYCYDNLSVCPYWTYSDIANALYGEQCSGYCHYLREGDFNSDTMILWDQCKCCGINDEEEES